MCSSKDQPSEGQHDPVRRSLAFLIAYYKTDLIRKRSSIYQFNIKRLVITRYLNELPMHSLHAIFAPLPISAERESVCGGVQQHSCKGPHDFLSA